MWTPMYDEHRAQFTAEELVAHDAAMAQMIAIDGRLGNPSRDLVPLIIFMLGEGSRYMTGQIISVNGGMNSRSEEHTSELQSLMRISYAVFCLKKKTKK